MLIVEVGFRLDHDFEYYDNMLKSQGFINVFNATTHDLYYTNKNLDNLEESQMKDSCIRLRNCYKKNGKDETVYTVQNNLVDDNDITVVKFEKLYEYEDMLEEKGYHKVFDTIKYDYHYYKDGMTSRIQIQDIKKIGLLVYYDNPNYYGLPLEQQRKQLIDELNSYGFEFNYDTLGLDKLRTLYYKEDKYSKNQAGQSYKNK